MGEEVLHIAQTGEVWPSLMVGAASTNFFFPVLKIEFFVGFAALGIV
jgi:hypothetical protein